MITMECRSSHEWLTLERGPVSAAGRHNTPCWLFLVEAVTKYHEDILGEGHLLTLIWLFDILKSDNAFDKLHYQKQ